MKYAITTTLLFFVLAMGAQSLDMNRMKRDVEVGENILASLLQESYEGINVNAPSLFLSDRSNVEGSYLEGFGVLFTIAPRHLLGSVNWGNGDFSFRHDQAVSIVVPRGEARGRQGRSSGMAGERDTISLESQFIKVVQDFASDYAFLLRQLPADEKIMIRYGGKPRQSGTWSVVSGVGFSSQKMYSAVIEKSDLDAHQSGRLNREQFFERIKFTSDEEGVAKEDRDLTLLTSIFSRLYQSDLSSNNVFRVKGTPDYEKIEGLGAVIHLSVGSKFSSHIFTYNNIRLRGAGSNRVRVVVPDSEDEVEGVIVDSDAEMEEGNPDDIDKAYPGFMKELKRNIVEYGSIVKDLPKDEALVFQVNFFDCDECKVMPKKAEITASQPTLEAYRKGSIDLDKGMGQLKVSLQEQ